MLWVFWVLWIGSIILATMILSKHGEGILGFFWGFLLGPLGVLIALVLASQAKKREEQQRHGELLVAIAHGNGPPQQEGAQAPDAPKSKPPDTKARKCTDCGQALNPGWRFCPNCGTYIKPSVMKRLADSLSAPHSST